MFTRFNFCAENKTFMYNELKKVKNNLLFVIGISCDILKRRKSTALFNIHLDLDID